MVDEVNAREVGAATAAPLVLPSIGTRWAVVVGISKYADTGLDLHYAHRDAIAVHDLIRTPEGGNFAAGNVRLLCDEQATTSAITRAVRGFLMEAMPDDLVLLFFACHGGPDPRRPAGPLYLYTYDTDPRDVSGTGFAMDEIDRSLQQLIRARRVVIIADTCHSGGIGGGPGGRAAVGAEATNRYLAAMAEAKGGVALLTSAEAAEASLEDRRWGGGHGVFTHFLLEGMRGAADGYGGEPKDGIVSVGELFEYVREQVQQATQGRQHPAVGTTRYDRRLPMAITGDLDVEQHLQLGRHLVEVGWMLDDPAPMLLAARQFALAADLKRRLPSADAERGAALLGAGLVEQAAEVLRTAVDAAPEELPADAWMHLGIAEAGRGSLAAAATSLRQFRLRSGDHDAWVEAYIDWLERPPGRLRALLIGAGTFPSGSGVSDLPGTANDVRLLASVLCENLGVDADDVDVCGDDQATRRRVRARLKALARGIGPDDAVFVYFTGHSLATAGADDVFLVTHDDQSRALTGVTPTELIDALDLPAREVVLALDTHISPAFLNLVDTRAKENLTVLLACGVGEVAYEKPIAGTPHGLFTAALAAELASRGRDATYETLIAAVKEAVQSDAVAPGQTPQAAGAAHGRVFGGRFVAAGLWRARRRWVPRETDGATLSRAVADYDDERDWWALGRLALARGDVDGALDHLGRALTGRRRSGVLFDLALAQLRRRDRVALSATLAEIGAVVAAAGTMLAAGPGLPRVGLIAPPSGAVVDDAGEHITGVVGALAPAAAVVRLGQEATIAAMRSMASELAARGVTTNVLIFAGSVQLGEGASYRLADGLLPAAELRAALPSAASIVGLLSIDQVIERDVGLHEDLLDGVDLGFDAAVRVRSSDDLDELVSRIGATWSHGSTFTEWTRGVATARIAPRLASRVVADGALWTAVETEVVGAQRAAAAEAARLAEQAIAQREARHEDHPEGYLQAGLAHAAAGHHAVALRRLRAARNLYDDPNINTAERVADPSADRWHMETRYHHGRLQYEHGGDLYDAVATLQAALQQNPDDPRVLFHLVRAIRALVERESLVEARRRARRYLELGAPLGGADELRAFVAATR